MRLAAVTDEFVVKHRLGSGFSGLALVDASGLEAAVAAAVASAPSTEGRVGAGESWSTPARRT